MNFKRVDQLLPGFAVGDATSQEALCIQALLKERGLESELFVDPKTDGSLKEGTCRSMDLLPDDPNGLVICHYGGQSPTTSRYLKSKAKKVLLYHNITPHTFWEGFHDEVARGLAAGREQLPELCAASDAVWTVSEYNAKELRECGAEDAQVFPLLFNPDRFQLAGEPEAIPNLTLPDGHKVFLFVGRLAPNKNVEELLQAFTIYHQRINPKSSLLLAGSEWTCPRYFAMLRLMAGEVAIPHIHFLRYVSDPQLAYCYGVADAFVCTSLHEGFCLPLVEAMYHHVPVIARKAGGMPEALGNAGVLFDDATPSELAELMDYVVSSEEVKQEVLTGQSKRIVELENRDPGAELDALLADVLRR